MRLCVGCAATDRVNSSCSSGSAHCCWWFRWSRPSTRNRRHRSGSNLIRWPGSSSSISSWNSRENISSSITSSSSRNSRLRPIIRLDRHYLSTAVYISFLYIKMSTASWPLFFGGRVFPFIARPNQCYIIPPFVIIEKWHGRLPGN